MKTNGSHAISSTSSSTALPPAPAPVHSPAAPEGKAGPGRPSCMNDRMIEALCSVIRATGISDSGAAARMSLHPSTVSRWKREFPDLAILFRAAREDFRSAQLDIIQREAESGRATGWRAAAWLLERIFPEDYAPRARERAQFQERFDAVCAAEAEGGMLALPTEGEPLQNVQNAGPLPKTPAPVAQTLPGALFTVPEPALPLQAASRRGATVFASRRTRCKM